MEKNITSNYLPKRYKHIDKRISYNKVESYVRNPQKVAGHSFLPFMHFEVAFEKFKEIPSTERNHKTRPIKEKKREIYYAGHLDSYIYRYYADKLNESYNIYMDNEGISDVAVAYRSNAPHKSNINFAAEAISKIDSLQNAIIIIGDFTSFFDTLDHKFLKNRLQRVLGVTSLDKDWYNIFKSLTKFGYIDKETLDTSDSNLVKNKKKDYAYFESLKDFWKYKKYTKINHNENTYGIPQGNALSGVLANIYAIDFDRKLLDIANSNNGLYRRYSDDFFLVLDCTNKSTDSDSIRTKVTNLAKENKIELQTDKTKCFLKEGKKIKIFDDSAERSSMVASHIDYLGFTFDGKNVKIREKSIYKFYRKAHKLIDTSKRIKVKKKLNYLPRRHMIYSLYTDFGYSKKYPSNFIDYVKRSQIIFDDISPNTNNLMMNQIKNRKSKLEKYLGYKTHLKI